MGGTLPCNRTSKWVRLEATKIAASRGANEPNIKIKVVPPTSKQTLGVIASVGADLRGWQSADVKTQQQAEWGFVSIEKKNTKRIFLKSLAKQAGEMFLGRLCGKYAGWRQHTHRGPSVLLPESLHPTTPAPRRP